MFRPHPQLTRMRLRILRLAEPGSVLSTMTFDHITRTALMVPENLDTPRELTPEEELQVLRYAEAWGRVSGVGA